MDHKKNKLLRQYTRKILKFYKDPTVIEFGSIRALERGSTFQIASTLNGKGKLYSFEKEIKHINYAKKICAAYLKNIIFVKGDCKKKFKDLAYKGLIKKVNLAFLDTTNDPKEALAEFKLVQPFITDPGFVLLHDVISGDTAKHIKPIIKSSYFWDLKTYPSIAGTMVIKRIK